MTSIATHVKPASETRTDRAPLSRLAQHLRLYWSLIKSLQTGLLLATGLAGYASALCPVTNWTRLLALTGSLFLAISGSTALNMVFDREIDAQMGRTANRPLPSGRVSVREATLLGLVLAGLGVAWAAWLAPLYGAVVFAGLFFDVVVYTLWLKRRTAWAIVWGGVSGGMPVLAGRVLATGAVDSIGVLMAAGVLLWIPTHIMTFSIRYSEDYDRAKIPTFPSTYGVGATRMMIAVSGLLAALAMIAAAIGIGMSWGYLRMLILLSTLLLFGSILSLARPSEKANFRLFKFASLYMLGAMILVFIQAVF